MTDGSFPLSERLVGQLCIVTSNYYPESIGGEETFIGQYCRYLSARGIPFTVVSASSALRRSGLDPIRIRPFAIPIANYEVYNLIWACLAALKILKIHSLERIGIIHSIDTGHAGLACVFAARLLRRRLVVHSHGRRSEAWRSILRSAKDSRAWVYWAAQRFIDRFVVRRANGVIAVSSEVVSFLESLGVHRDKILMAPSAVEIVRYQNNRSPSLRKALRISKDAFVIGYLGRLAALKGIEVLIDAYASFDEQSPGSSFLLLAGDGPLRSDLEARVIARSLTNVLFLGAQADTATFLKALDVFVLPSYAEGSPVSLLEAMATGCPIIASDIQAVRDVAKGSVLIFPPGAASNLAEMLTLLKNNSRMRKSLSEAAVHESRAYSTTTILPRILAFSIGS